MSAQRSLIFDHNTDSHYTVDLCVESSEPYEMGQIKIRNALALLVINKHEQSIVGQ